MISQVTAKFQDVHLDWQYLDPRFPLLGYKRLFNLQGYHNFEIATYPGAYKPRFNLQKFKAHTILLEIFQMHLIL